MVRNEKFENLKKFLDFGTQMFIITWKWTWKIFEAHFEQSKIHGLGEEDSPFSEKSEVGDKIIGFANILSNSGWDFGLRSLYLKNFLQYSQDQHQLPHKKNF